MYSINGHHTTKNVCKLLQLAYLTLDGANRGSVAAAMDGLSMPGFLPLPAYVFLPHVNGMYLYFTMWAIWFFIVSVKSTMK
jgi:hypothetical protein